MFTLYRNAFCHATKKAIWSIMNSNDPGRRKSFTRIEHCASAIGREGLVRSIPVLTPEYVPPSQRVPGLAPRYLITSSTVRVGVHTSPVYDSKPIWYLTLHFQDRLGAAFLRHRNRAATTVLVCEQRPYRIWFSWRRQSYPVKCEHSLKAPLGYNQRRSYQRYEMIEYGFYISSFIFAFPFCLIFLHFL